MEMTAVRPCMKYSQSLLMVLIFLSAKDCRAFERGLASIDALGYSVMRGRRYCSKSVRYFAFGSRGIDLH